MDIQLNFDKKTIRIKAIKYLTKNMTEEGDRKNILWLMNKTKLAYQEAKKFIQGPLSAMIMEEMGNNKEEEVEISPEMEEETGTQAVTQTQNEDGHTQTQTSKHGTQDRIQNVGNTKPDFSNVYKS